MSNIATLQARAIALRQRYAALNQQQGRAIWGAKDYAMGFVGDVGDLQKLVMAKENMRDIADTDAKLAHELADCLWSVMVLADHYNVDLEAAFTKTMNELETRITEASQ